MSTFGSVGKFYRVRSASGNLPGGTIQSFLVLVFVLVLVLVLVLFFQAGTAYSDSAARYRAVPLSSDLTFDQPVDLVPHASAARGAGEERDALLYVVERKGRIYSFNRKNGSKKLVLDLTGKVDSTGIEEGLLGLAFHPKYDENLQLFIYYTAADPSRKVLARLRMKEGEGTVDPDSHKTLLELPQPYANHNGGSLRFGPDGYLYVGVGDGGSGGDPHGHGQNLETLLGALLRLDVDKAGEKTPYGIPTDNPFAGRKGARAEIYAYGLRNPWRFSFDSKTGDLWLADVGQNRLEEINIIRNGGNYGWNIMEGSECFSPRYYCEKDGLEMPVWEYPHSEGQSVTGGVVYHGTRLPELQGKYIYSDFVSGRVWALALTAGKPVNELLMHSPITVSSIAEDLDGEVLLLSFQGKILRLEQNK